MTEVSNNLRERLEESQRRVAERTQRDAETMLVDRARKLAQRELTVRVPDVVAEVTVCRRGRSTWGFPTRGVEEVRSVHVVPLRTPSRIIVGLFQLRGRIHSLVDLYALFGDADPMKHGDSTLAILLNANGNQLLGVRIDEIVGPRLVHRNELEDRQRKGSLRLTSAVTRDFLEIIDLDALYKSQALVSGAAPHEDVKP